MNHGVLVISELKFTMNSLFSNKLKIKVVVQKEFGQLHTLPKIV